MSRPRIRVTHHARKRWKWRYTGDDLKEIEDELAVARPASKKVRRILLHRRREQHAKNPNIDPNRRGKPGFLVTREWVFPCSIVNDCIIVTTVLYRRDLQV